MKILVFDNYDSFTYNLVHLVEKITHDKVDVVRNDQLSLDDVKKYDKIILSPGPGIPKEAGLLLPLIREYASSKSMLGVCLGHQAIGEAFGGTLINLSTVYHGVATPITLNNSIGEGDEQNESQVYGSRRGLFTGLNERIDVGRYHSWIVADIAFPDVLEVTARDDNGYIMALQHKQFDVQGVQMDYY